MNEIYPLKCFLYSLIGTSRFGTGRLKRVEETMYSVFSVTNGEAWLPVLSEKLERGGWLAPGAWIYLEDAAARGEPRLPAGWTLLRSKRAGDVGYHLARRGSPAHNNDHQARGSE